MEQKPDVIDNTDPDGLLLQEISGIKKQHKIRSRIPCLPEHLDGIVML